MSIAQLQHPQSSALGSLVWFGFGGPVEYIDGKRTVLPVKVNTEDLYTWFAELGLDESILPPQVRRIDKFRAVTSAARHRYEVTGGRAELYVEEVAFDHQHVLRNVMRRVTDENRMTTNIDHVATLKFIRGGRTATKRRTENDHWRSVILTKVREPDRAEVEKFIAGIDEAYRGGAEALETTGLRSVVRRYLLSLNGVALRSSGGIYFVPCSTADVVPALAEVIRRIDSPGCSLDYIPYLASDHNRAVLRQAFEADLMDDCGTLERAIETRKLQALARGRISPAHLAELRGRYEEIAARADLYYEELGLLPGAEGEAIKAVAAKLGELNPIRLRK